MSQKETLSLPGYTRHKASKPRGNAGNGSSYEPMLLKENLHLVWVAETLRKTLPKSRTHRVMKMKFDNTMKLLEDLGQEREITHEVLRECKIFLPETQE